MKIFYACIFICFYTTAFAQPGGITGTSLNQLANWQIANTKAAGDSCGIYYNNYIGINKTIIMREEPLRTGNLLEGSFYNGRAQRFNAPQPIEVSGVEFYGYIKNNPALDSIMVITTLNNYEAFTDSVGVELARDTVYVTHHAFTINLPNISIQSHFNTPITVTNDYIVSIYTPTDDSLFIIANDPFSGAGNGENLSHALYDNVNYPSYQGWYSMLTDFNFDYDYLIAPLVKFDLHDGFNVVNDTICPGISGNACVSYAQKPIFINHQYNAKDATPTNSIFWNWDDGTFNTTLTSACHTYNNAGTYAVNLKDTLFKWDYVSNHCIINLVNNIVALDSVIPNFTFNQLNSTVDFISTTTGADSIWWDFGDGTMAGNVNTTNHFYDTLGTYNVWLHAINNCTEDSIMIQITTDDVGIDENNNEISIYPNPANAYLAISNLPLNTTINVYNIIGEMVTVKINNNLINTSNLSAGTYFVSIKNNSLNVTKKVIVTH